MAEEQCFKSEGRGFQSSGGHWIFLNLPSPFNRTMAPEFTQLLTEMSTEDVSGGKVWPGA
jgi:hypothetical protein